MIFRNLDRQARKNIRRCLNFVKHKGRPANPWWEYLKKCSQGNIFPQPTPEAVGACNRIKEGYRPILSKHGIDYDDFFGGSIKDDDAAALYDIVRKESPRIAYQVGTFVGYSAAVMADALLANGKGILIAVDPEIPHRTLFNPVDVAREAAESLGLTEQLRFVRGWHSCPMGDEFPDIFKMTIPISGPETLNRLEAPVDFAFIDGDHSLTATISDFMLLKDYMALNGVVVFHDVYSWPTVAHALSLIIDDTHYNHRGMQNYFSIDTKFGPDGLAAFRRIANADRPCCRIQVTDAHGAPLKDARIHIPLLDFQHNSTEEGCVYLFCDITAQIRMEIDHPHCHSYSGPVGVATSGGFNETTVCLCRETDPLLQGKQGLYPGGMEGKATLPIVRSFGIDDLAGREAKERKKKEQSRWKAEFNTPLIHGHPALFPFHSRLKNLCRIDLLMGTYNRENPGRLVLKLWRDSKRQELCREISVASPPLRDNDFAAFEFPLVEDSENTVYYISVELADGVENLSPGIWYGEVN